MHAAEHWSFLSFLKPFLFYVNEVWVGCAVVEWSPHVRGVTILNWTWSNLFCRGETIIDSVTSGHLDPINYPFCGTVGPRN